MVQTTHVIPGFHIHLPQLGGVGSRPVLRAQ